MTYDPNPLHDIEPRVTCQVCGHFQCGRWCQNSRGAGLHTSGFGPNMADRLGRSKAILTVEVAS